MEYNRGVRKTSFEIILILGLILISSKNSFADVNTTVNISNNGANSKNTVNVETNTGGNTVLGQSTSETKTNIRIETNGQVKTYNSDKPEDVNIESDNGNIKVNIKNNGSSTLGTSVNSKDIENQKATTEAKIKEKKEEIEEKKQEILQKNQKQIFSLRQFLSEQLKSLEKLFKFPFFSK